MLSNNKLSHFQQQRIQSYTQTTGSHQFFNLLTCPELLETVQKRKKGEKKVSGLVFCY